MRCSGGREANFTWLLVVPLAAPLNAGVRPIGAGRIGMNEKPAKLLGKRIIIRRKQLSLVLGTCITIVFGLMLNLLPFRIGKILFWPALPFVRVYDEQLGAP